MPDPSQHLVWEPSKFRDLVSGRRRGLGAALMRAGLRLAETPYAWAMRWRNRRYDRGAAAVYRLDVPVISVGNLTLGGTGKTPLVYWLAQWFQGRAIPVAVISRGYHARQGDEHGQNDEARELAARLPGVCHLQNPDRVAAARQAVGQFHCRAILLDDAFQHRRIARDLDIVLLDALEPLGFGHVFPRGTLREPLEGLRRADLVALSRADALEPQERAELRRHIAQLAPQAAWLEMRHAPRALLSAGGAGEPLESLQGRPVAAFCGIGNPAGFRHTLAACGYHVAAFREFPDHHGYTPHDLAELAQWAKASSAAALLCTQKDLVKLPVDQLGGLPLRAVAIDLEILAGREVLESRLEILARKVAHQ
jgi:tetraacyldisaccharide 4'-kinase